MDVTMNITELGSLDLITDLNIRQSAGFTIPEQIIGKKIVGVEIDVYCSTYGANYLSYDVSYAIDGSSNDSINFRAGKIVDQNFQYSINPLIIPDDTMIKVFIDRNAAQANDRFRISVRIITTNKNVELSKLIAMMYSPYNKTNYESN